MNSIVSTAGAAGVSTAGAAVVPPTCVEYSAGSFLTSSDDGDVVGAGSYGVVRKCRHDVLGRVVVKCMHSGGAAQSAAGFMEEARKRVSILSRFKHDHIVRIHGMTSWGQCFGIVMEEVERGNLRDLIIVNKTVEQMAWKLRYRIVFELADALRYLHHHYPDKSYIHLDVKPENVLLSLGLNVKLADFGSLDIAIATGAQPTTSVSPSNQYTPLYTAPERLQKLYCKPKSSMDVYSFAMICYEVITRQEVFQDARANVFMLTNLIASRGQKPNTEHIDSVEQQLKKFHSKDIEIFQMLKHVMENCWCFSAQDRLTMEEVGTFMTSFAEPDSSFMKEIKRHICDVARSISHTQRSLDDSKERVSLHHHSPPFQRSAGTSGSLNGSVNTESRGSLNQDQVSTNETPRKEAKSTHSKSYADTAKKPFPPPTRKTNSRNETYASIDESGASFDVVELANAKRYLALYDYNGQTFDDMSFEKNEVMLIPNTDGEWWLGLSLSTQNTGYVPKNYIIEMEFKWYFGRISRKEAERLLKNPANVKGTFLIRESESAKETFTLSVLDGDVIKDGNVRHYRIRETPSGMCYISDRVKFNEFKDLVRFYQNKVDGLCCLLKNACPVTAKKESFNSSGEWEIPREALSFQSRLDSTMVGEIWHGTWWGAAVMIRKQMPGKVFKDGFLAEAKMMQSLKHENLLKFYGVVSEDPVCIVVEYSRLGNLMNYLLNGAGQRSTLVQHIGMATEIASGMAYIESFGGVHRDLRALNVTVDEDSHVCKIDVFGMAGLTKKIHNIAAQTKFFVKWRAPETMVTGDVTIKSDVWSFGVLLMEIITKGGIPYEGKSNDEVLKLVQEGYRMPKPEMGPNTPPCPDSLYELMLDCWKSKPSERPSFEHIKDFLKDSFRANKANDSSTSEQDDPSPRTESLLDVVTPQ